MSWGREMLRSCFFHFLYIRKKFKLDDSSKVKHVRRSGGKIPKVPFLKLTPPSPHLFLQQRRPLSTVLLSTARGPSPTPSLPLAEWSECPLPGPGPCVRPSEAIPRTSLQKGQTGYSPCSRALVLRETFPSHLAPQCSFSSSPWLCTSTYCSPLLEGNPQKDSDLFTVFLVVSSSFFCALYILHICWKNEWLSCVCQKLKECEPRADGAWHVTSLSLLLPQPQPAKRSRKKEGEEFVCLRTRLQSSWVCSVGSFRAPWHSGLSQLGLSFCHVSGFSVSSTQLSPGV